MLLSISLLEWVSSFRGFAAINDSIFSFQLNGHVDLLGAYLLLHLYVTGAHRWRSRWNPAPGKFYPPISRVAVRTSESLSYVQLPEVLPALPASVDDSESRPGSPPCDLPTAHRQLRPLLRLHFFWGH